MGVEAVPILESYLPPEVFAQREKFFYEGMRLEIGPCFRDYSPPAFFRDATERFRGEARLLENGGLEGYTAGLPFAPDTIDPEDPRAGMQWAWNAAHRYEGAGFRGTFRVADIYGEEREGERFAGEIFQLELAHRADRPGDDYRAPRGDEWAWVVGGELTEPFDAREYAWRQYRGLGHAVDPDRSDDLHVYIPERRRVRRANASNVEGIYLPTFAIGGARTGSTLPIGGGAGGVGGAIAPSPGAAGTVMERRSGFEGLELRPLLYEYELLGLQDVLAPINAKTPSYPEDEERDFGPYGLSFASDRFELRRALVLEGTVQQKRGPDDRVDRIVQYVDLQTLSPLYYVSYDDENTPIDVGMFVGRWSGDRLDYPSWPDDADRPVRVIDPVGAAFANLRERGGWRRESWDVVSVPPDDQRLERMLSLGNLTRGR